MYAKKYIFQMYSFDKSLQKLCHQTSKRSPSLVIFFCDMGIVGRTITTAVFIHVSIFVKCFNFKKKTVNKIYPMDLLLSPFAICNSTKKIYVQQLFCVTECGMAGQGHQILVSLYRLLLPNKKII